MTNNLLLAKSTLKESNFTCVIVKNEKVYTSEFNGVKPAITWLNEDPKFLEDASVADLVVGKAAAMLFIYGKVKNIHANLISKPAIEVLNQFNIEYTYDEEVDYIINRTNDGMCPLEKCVLNINDPALAYQAIKDTIKELMKAK